MSTNIFDKRTGFCSDDCWKTAKDNNNQEIESYYLYPNNPVPCSSPNVRKPNMYLDHIN